MKYILYRKMKWFTFVIFASVLAVHVNAMLTSGQKCDCRYNVRPVPYYYNFLIVSNRFHCLRRGDDLYMRGGDRAY